MKRFRVPKGEYIGISLWLEENMGPGYLGPYPQYIKIWGADWNDYPYFIMITIKDEEFATLFRLRFGYECE
jgi:hypothetical protein